MGYGAVSSKYLIAARSFQRPAPVLNYPGAHPESPHQEQRHSYHLGSSASLRGPGSGQRWGGAETKYTFLLTAQGQKVTGTAPPPVNTAVPQVCALLLGFDVEICQVQCLLGENQSADLCGPPECILWAVMQTVVLKLQWASGH